jgi:hypothetical protein
MACEHASFGTVIRAKIKIRFILENSHAIPIRNFMNRLIKHPKKSLASELFQAAVQMGKPHSPPPENFRLPNRETEGADLSMKATRLQRRNGTKTTTANQPLRLCGWTFTIRKDYSPQNQGV